MSHDPKSGAPIPDDSADSAVEVLRTSETTAIPVIKSILDGAEIRYYTRGETMMNLFPSELLAPSLLRPKGQVAFMVAAEDAEEARQLLTPVDDPEALEGEP